MGEAFIVGARFPRGPPCGAPQRICSSGSSRGGGGGSLRPPLPSGTPPVTPFFLSVSLQAALRVPARINDLTRRRSRADSRVAWVGGEPGARGPAGGPEGLGLLRRSEEKAEEREPRRRSRGACGGKGSSGPGRASAGRRLSRRRRRAPAAAAPGGFKLCGPVMPE
ncbi:PREDICTED: uncharacterized protein LOC101367480 [Odobenus rosmarus divergens]|uniref:Uncharacterized protein LOC101367480 n=1 Tax=Odobenus rosmarus divergens TaxID=9708 RepID=A0A9B0GZ34_ODORO